MEVNQSNKMLKNSKNPCAKCLISRYCFLESTHIIQLLYIIDKEERSAT